MEGALGWTTLFIGGRGPLATPQNRPCFEVLSAVNANWPRNVEYLGIIAPRNFTNCAAEFGKNLPRKTVAFMMMINIIGVVVLSHVVVCDQAVRAAYLRRGQGGRRDCCWNRPSATLPRRRRPEPVRYDMRLWKATDITTTGVLPETST